LTILYGGSFGISYRNSEHYRPSGEEKQEKRREKFVVHEKKKE